MHGESEEFDDDSLVRISPYRPLSPGIIIIVHNNIN